MFLVDVLQSSNQSSHLVYVFFPCLMILHEWGMWKKEYGLLMIYLFSIGRRRGICIFASAALDHAEGQQQYKEA